MGYKLKLSAASLPTTLVVSTLMLLSVMGIFLLWDKNNNEISSSHYKMQKIMNLESSLTLYCHDSTLISRLSEDNTLQLYDNKESSEVQITITPFGLYEIVNVSSDGGKFYKSAIVGSANMGYSNATFYLADNDRPLSITGNSNLFGEVYIPKFGVGYNQMQSQFFSGEKIEKENIKVSEKELPETITREPLDFADELIVISKDMFLEDTIIVAKSIVVENGFIGTVQLMACDTVMIESGVTLKYPSGIYLSGENPDRYIEINEKSQISGYVVIEKCDTKSQRPRANFQQDIKSEVKGVVYINGIAQMQGVTTGKVFCDEVSLFTPQGIYQNTIYNLTVIENNEIASPILIKNAPYERRIIKWLN